MFVKAKLIIYNKELTTYANNPGSLLEIIVQAGIAVDAPCAGLGRCGKCRVHVIGSLQPDNIEMALLSREDIKAGIRLACRKRDIPHDLTIQLSQVREEYVRTAYKIEPADVGIAIDFGTTSIVIALINMSQGNIIAMKSILNPQRIYGADVVSRIKAGLDTAVLEQMKDRAVHAVAQEIHKLLEEIGLKNEAIKSVHMAGNTTMEHIIAGMDVSGLAKAPYKPVFTEMRHVPDLKTILGVETDDINLFPIIGGFVGGDTVASMLACTMDRTDETIALIDIGTNAEIAVGNKSSVFVSSAPAGPAFEGGEIRQGMRAQDGAIEDIHVTGDALYLDVKGDTEPEGICGSGLIRLVAELMKAGVITPQGELLDAGSIQDNLSLRVVKKDDEQAFMLYRSYEHNVYLYQSDIRALQLAKASVAAGLDLIIKLSGMKPSKLFIAGAFGNYLRPDDLKLIGMIPSDLARNAYFIGDSVIAGLKRFIINEPEVAMDNFLSHIEHIELADDPSFNKRFLSMIELKAF